MLIANRIENNVSYYMRLIPSVRVKNFDFHIFQERQKIEKLLLGVSYIAESQIGLYLVTFKFTVIGVLSFQ